MSDQTLYAIHDPGGEHLFSDKRGTIVFTEALGADPTHRGGGDYRVWSSKHRVIVRLNYGYSPDGTLPSEDKYEAFAQRVLNFIKASQGCTHWIVGNEPNHEQEWPQGQVITPHQYAKLFNSVAAWVHRELGAEHEMILAALAPWNVQASYTGNETGDWLRYFYDMLESTRGYADAIALHTYTHGADPALIVSNATMDAPYQQRFANFRAYQDFLSVVPLDLRHLPVYITETDQDSQWADVNSGWVQEAYAEIDRWNKLPGKQRIRCLALFRWPAWDERWGFEKKAGVHEDMRQAVTHNYLDPGLPLQTSQTLVEPSKSSASVFAPYIPATAPSGSTLVREWDARLTSRGVSVQTPVVAQSAPFWKVAKAHWLDVEEAQGRHHIYVDVLSEAGERLVGVPLLVTWPDGKSVIKTEAKAGEPYAANYPMPASRNEFSIEIIEGKPSERVVGLGMGRQEPGGYNAGAHTSTALVFQLANAATVTDVGAPPSVVETSLPMAKQLVRPCAGVVTQRWGENPSDYARFGIPGHNGIDIANTQGTPIRAVADGTVAFIGFDISYGTYVRIAHPQLGLDSFYAHLLSVTCAVGQFVKQGQDIAAMGSTGNSTGPHLHLELRAGSGAQYINLRGGYGKGRFDPAIAYWLLNREII